MNRKIQKNSLDEHGYADMADYCNSNNLLIEQDSDYYYLVTDKEQVVNGEIVSKGDEFLLTKAKEELIEKIKRYDISENVNLFYYNNIPSWLDKATRVGLKSLISDLKLIGETTVTISLTQYDVILSLEEAETMLARLEYYASQCYNTTQKHLRLASDLISLLEVKEFDITKGYPEYLWF